MMRKHNMLPKFAIAALLLLACFAGSVFGQTSGTGTIAGTITDPSGAVVPGASVKVVNTDNGIERKTGTNEAGIYTAAFLRPGHYEVSVEKTGLTSVLRKDLT